MAGNLLCKIHPVVLFSIVDSYERRNEDAKRVIGTLLGVYDKGVVEVTNCFAVPHNESEDEVAIDIEFARNMYELHRKVNPTEVIVGWYSTGSEVTEHSVLIHEYYARECKNPVHFTLDTTLNDAHMGMKAFLSAPLGIPDKTVGTIFTPVPVELTTYEPEKVAVDFIQMGKHNPKRMVNMVTDLQQVGATCAKLQDMLTQVMQYVDDVIAGKIPADNRVGRYLMDLAGSVPKLGAEEFEKMLNSSMKDVLMVLYLSNLTRTQLMINEKINLV